MLFWGGGPQTNNFWILSILSIEWRVFRRESFVSLEPPSLVKIISIWILLSGCLYEMNLSASSISTPIDSLHFVKYAKTVSLKDEPVASKISSLKSWCLFSNLETAFLRMYAKVSKNGRMPVPPQKNTWFPSDKYEIPSPLPTGPLM